MTCTTPAGERFIMTLRRRIGILNPFATEALDHTQVYLTLSHDTSCGSLSLKNDTPLLDMSGVERASVMHQVKKMLPRMTHALDDSHLETGLESRCTLSVALASQETVPESPAPSVILASYSLETTAKYMLVCVSLTGQ